MDGPPICGTETELMLGGLERQRAIFAWKCGNLDHAGLQVRVGASTMTLAGLLKHMAVVEDWHFARLLLAGPPEEPWVSVDWEANPDWEWTSAGNDSPEELMALWERSVELSRTRVAAALEPDGMDTLGEYVNADGSRPNLRRILLDLIEEYARHIGHADLLREAADGLVGEDPPG